MKTPSNKPKVAFPYTVSVPGISGVTATIYRQQQKRESFVLSYNLLGKRKLVRFKEFDKARAAGQMAIKAIGKSEQEAHSLKGMDAYQLLRAKQALTGQTDSVDQVCQRWSQCLDILAGVGTPEEACKEYAARHAGLSAKVTVPGAVSQMLEQERKQVNGKRKSAWVKLLEGHVQNKFARDFQVTLAQVDSGALNLWLANLETSPRLLKKTGCFSDKKRRPCSERTKKNVRDCLAHFFKWCRAAGYLAKDCDPLENVTDFRKRKRGKIHTLTPDELSALLTHVSPQFLPYVAIRAFAGLRDSEAKAIDWRNVDLDSGWIEITEEVAKNSDDGDGTRRLVPIRGVLKAWLEPFAQKHGRLCPFENTNKQLQALCKAAGVTWKRNSIRHSFISYAVAEGGDIPQVATHSGNSPAIIKQHYWNPATRPETAKKWFGVLPAKAIFNNSVTELRQMTVR